MRLLLVMVTLAACSSITALAQDGMKKAKRDARESLEAFFAAWNDADNEGLRNHLNYPHFTLFNSRMIIAEQPEEFTVDFVGMRANERWNRSTLDTFDVFAASDDKVHCEVVYSRYNTEGEKYRTGKVVYIVTNDDGHWGMQFRCPVPMDGGSNSQSEEAARDLFDTFFKAFNAADNERLQAITNYPHAFLLSSGRAAIARNDGEMVMNFDRMRENEGWRNSILDQVTVRYATENQVHADIVFSRYNAEGERYRSVPALWIFTKDPNDRWGIQFRSLLPPTFVAE